MINLVIGHLRVSQVHRENVTYMCNSTFMCLCAYMCLCVKVWRYILEVE